MSMRNGVIWFGEKMEQQLKAHAQKYSGGWANKSTVCLSEKIGEHHDFLEEAMHHGEEDEMVKQAIHIANYAMMLAHNVNAGKLNEKGT